MAEDYEDVGPGGFLYQMQPVRLVRSTPGTGPLGRLDPPQGCFGSILDTASGLEIPATKSQSSPTFPLGHGRGSRDRRRPSSPERRNAPRRSCRRTGPGGRPIT
jgi:hypothetical protein